MATLFVVEGPACGQHFALEEHRLVMIGRDSKCTFQLVDPQVSRLHLQLKRAEAEGHHVAIDFSSHNGIFINQQRMEQDTVLNDGDAITIGATTMIYSRADSPEGLRAREMMRKFGEGHLKTTF